MKRSLLNNDILWSIISPSEDFFNDGMKRSSFKRRHFVNKFCPHERLVVILSTFQWSAFFLVTYRAGLTRQLLRQSVTILGANNCYLSRYRYILGQNSLFLFVLTFLVFYSVSQHTVQWFLSDTCYVVPNCFTEGPQFQNFTFCFLTCHSGTENIYLYTKTSKFV